MQLTHAEVTPIELKLHSPIHMAHQPTIEIVTAIFVRLETRRGQSAWGVTVSHPALTGDTPAEALKTAHACAQRIPDLHPLNIEFTLATLAPICEMHPSVLCAFDLALHDLLALAADMPLYRLLGGYRDRIQTSITLPLAALDEMVDNARRRVAQGFRILKLKGGLNPVTDVECVRAVQRALPGIRLRLDADGGYDVRTALEVARSLEGKIEWLEQPTPAGDLQALREVTLRSPTPILADQSACGPASALQISAGRCANGLAVKLASCGGLAPARQVEAIARAGRLSILASCLVEPAMLTAAGLAFALSSPAVQFGDLDGFLHLADDPSLPGFTLHEGQLIASDVVGLGYSVNL